ncbi:hypothetical protein PIB30_007415 [Stylosanthes scabra]|uniref:Uncharacterized protein n=1 Tax=Stylosanthes scabra TaxID=79078 RepID=A0ABU6Q4J9_9FABA|nr:hypothetical protein [Stylosanthes scabra]
MTSWLQPLISILDKDDQYKSFFEELNSIDTTNELGFSYEGVCRGRSMMAFCATESRSGSEESELNYLLPDPIDPDYEAYLEMVKSGEMDIPSDD